MSWLDWLAWRRKSATSAWHADVERLVVIDVETSGLETQTAQLLAIACIAAKVDWSSRQLTLIPADSFEVIVQPYTLVTDKSNILVHHIGQQSQSLGVPVGQALQMFTQFVNQSPLLAFHAGFDESILKAHIQREDGNPLENDWLDIAELCHATHPKVQAHTLDEWLAYFGIVCVNRHQAVADAWVEAEVLQHLWPHLSSQCSNWRDLQRLSQQHRWMR